MVFGNIIGAIGGAIIGGVVNGVAASKNNKIKIAAMEKATKDMKKATEEYTGEKALEKMYNAGLQGAYEYGTSMGNEMASQVFTPQNPGSTGTGINSAAMQAGTEAGDVAKNAAQAGFNSGMNNEAAMNAAKYNQAANKANLELKQADIDYNVANQASQEIMGGLGDLGKAIGGTIPTSNPTPVSKGIRGKPVQINNGNPLME
jgi:hypothetical protein